MPMTTGEVLTYTTPATTSILLTPGQYKFQCWGAQGGYRTATSYGGKGGYAEGVLTLTKRTTIYVTVGGAGGNSNTNSNSVNQGGYNGGGYRYGFPGGGGASDIRIKRDSYYTRVIVAGGGGSDGKSSNRGGYGGGTSGQAASGGYGTNGQGGAQAGFTTSGVTAAASQHTTNANTSWPGGFGFGGFGVSVNSGYAGAGGGGWYGGCGAVPDSGGDDDKGGGGGSGFVYTSSTAASVPSGWLLDSPYYLTSTKLTAGNASMPKVDGSGTETGHEGNGAVKITAIQAAPDTGEDVIKEDLGEIVLRIPSSAYSYYGLKTYLNNMIYRGADLLSLSRFEDIETLYKYVSAGNLRDIYVGDYVTVNSMKYIVMGVNTYKDTGVVEGNKHHLVLVPEHCIGQEQMNTTNTNEAGYAGSSLYTILQGDTYLGALMAGFGNHLLDGTWTLTTDNLNHVDKFTTKIRLLNETAVFGKETYGNLYDVGEMNTILPGFELKTALRKKQNNGSATYWWLSSIYRSDSFTFSFVYLDGTANWGRADGSLGIAPMILFG